MRREARQEMLAESHKHPAHSVLRQVRWLGPIRVALLIALIQTPHRFRTKRQLWGVLGRDHPDTLTTRSNIASWTGRTGDAPEALRLFRELLPDQERVLGRDHPDTLATRNRIASLEKNIDSP